jgi:hypothetical protein
VSTGAERATAMRRAAGQTRFRLPRRLGAGQRSRTGGEPPPRWPAREPRSTRCGQSIPILSSTRRSCSAGRCGGWPKSLPEGGRALVVGHSPTNEAAVYGLVGQTIAAMGKGEGVLAAEDSGR